MPKRASVRCPGSSSEAAQDTCSKPLILIISTPFCVQGLQVFRGKFRPAPFPIGRCWGEGRVSGQDLFMGLPLTPTSPRWAPLGRGSAPDFLPSIRFAYSRSGVSQLWTRPRGPCFCLFEVSDHLIRNGFAPKSAGFVLGPHTPEALVHGRHQWPIIARDKMLDLEIFYLN